MTISVGVFDAYGTLFDVAAAARKAAAEPGREALAGAWPLLADTWRAKQLQYTWIRAIAGEHADFWQVTQEALDFALEAHSLNGKGLRDRLLQLYWELEAYPDAQDILTALKAAGMRTAILSNGSPDMLQAAVEHAGIDDRLDAILSVESVGVFKPNRAVYDLVGQRFGVAPSEVAFVSSNGWDAAAAAGYGFHSVWVNRAGDPVDRLPWKPAEVFKDLRGAQEAIVNWAEAA
jgi:2-haloacid dehalogenase